MPDYEHDLQFGFCLDPSAADHRRSTAVTHLLDNLAETAGAGSFPGFMTRTRVSRDLEGIAPPVRLGIPAL